MKALSRICAISRENIFRDAIHSEIYGEQYASVLKKA